MSKISSSASRTTPSSKPAPKLAPKPAAKPQADSSRSTSSSTNTTGASKPAVSSRTSDSTGSSNETSRSQESSSRRETENRRHASETNEARATESNEGVDETSETRSDNAVKDPQGEDGFEGSQELQEELDGDGELREELKGLKDALAALFDNLSDDEEKEEEVQAAENMGGCCGRKASEATDSEGGEKDWNSVLAAGVAAVKANDILGGLGTNQQGAFPVAGPQGQRAAAAQGGVPAQGLRNGAGANQASGVQPGNPGQAGASPGQSRANGQNVDPRQKLSSDYQKAQSAGAQLKPELEAEVRSLLGLPPLDGEQGAVQGINGGLGANPAAGFGQNPFGSPSMPGALGNQFPIASGF